jgi:hypothetical protein
VGGRWSAVGGQPSAVAPDHHRQQHQPADEEARGVEGEGADVSRARALADEGKAPDDRRQQQQQVRPQAQRVASHGAEEEETTDYTDFTDYIPIICEICVICGFNSGSA